MTSVHMMNRVGLLTLLWSMGAYAAPLPCKFDDQTNEFVGTPIEQATCLLRPVERFGKLGEPQQLPGTLASKIDSTIDVTEAEMAEYITTFGPSAEEGGGALGKPLNPKTKYFIIHDTSTPNFADKPFPSNINDPNGPGNKLANYSARAHVYVNRAGASATKVDFAMNMRTTKFELQSASRKNIAVGIELTQPRRSYPDGTKKNDATAPQPGFTKEQLHRLAELYFIASVRAGRYLIPAFHSVVDAGLPSAHDDPQNFDLKAWDEQLDKVLFEIRGGVDAHLREENQPAPEDRDP